MTLVDRLREWRDKHRPDNFRVFINYFRAMVVPHFARMLVGPDHRRLLPAAGFLGGIFLLAMDDIARCITVQEVPIGVLTALVGTPVFAFMFWRTQAKGWTNE